MGLLPENHADRIAFFTSRTALWTSNATAIGTSTTQVTDVATKATAASAALAAQLGSQNAAKAATATLVEAMAALTNSGNIVIEQVRTKARSAGDSVYPLANIPAPATPTSRPPPGTPFALKVALKPNGALELKWKCNNPAGSVGTIYQIGRKVDGAATFEYLGGSGTKDFVDETTPAGSSQITYQIQGVRSSAVGDAAEFVVNIGTTSGGEMTVSISDGGGNGPKKIAA